MKINNVVDTRGIADMFGFSYSSINTWLCNPLFEPYRRRIDEGKTRWGYLVSREFLKTLKDYLHTKRIHKGIPKIERLLSIKELWN